MISVKQIIGGILVCLMACATLLDASTTTPMFFTLRANLVLQSGGVLTGRHDVQVRISGVRTTFTETFSNVLFVNGQCSILVGQGRQPLVIDNLRGANPQISLSLPNNPSVSPVQFPIPSSAYAIQARVAEEVKSVDASVISGAFTSTVNVANDLIVNTSTLFVDASTGRVGIATTNVSDASIALNVGGAVNASGYLVGGQDIEAALSWEKSGQNIIYTDGFVGIATANPQFDLDVAGTLNAREILINEQRIQDVLQESLSWRDGANGRDIFFDDGIASNGGFVGIGTSQPEEKLDVRGAIRIGEWISRGSGQPRAGTIQYVVQGSEADFQGYTGGEWKSLIGIQGEGTSNRLVYWTGQKTLDSADEMFWDDDDGLLGIGLGPTATPDARLDIRATTNHDVMHLKNSNDQTVFHIGQRNVGIGKTNAAFPLDVQGIVNANEYRINGSPLNLSLSSGTFWQLENQQRLYYDLGNVGIGTTQPRNLLEIASVTENPSITFDIQGQDLFTMGLETSNPDAFVISKGGDLSLPVFTFFGDKIGVGTNSPRANLHVSGNSGVLVEGTFGVGATLAESGAGTKLLWVPKKAAFRAGRVLGNGWDEANLGNHSVAMGQDPIASGEASVVGGGVDNRARGDHSTVPGGFKNIADGRFSYAAGHEAHARNTGAYVWSDYTPSSDVVPIFRSTQPNQYLIRAHNGVGINTADTSDAVLTIARDSQHEYIMKATGAAGDTALVLTTSGNLGLGTIDPGTAGLAVMNGRVGIGTTQPTANLHVQGTNSGELLFAATSEDIPNPTASFMVNDQGLVAIGYTLGHTFDPTKTLDVNGAIIGRSFAVETETGIVLLTPNPGSPWSAPDPQIANATSYILGNVGIGIRTPNSLLELGDENVSGSTLPVITFDIGGSDLMSIGPTVNADNEHLFVFQAGSTIGPTPSMVIGSKNVGIGINLNTPVAPLHVSGNTFIQGNVGVATTNFTDFTFNVNGALNVSELFQNGELFRVPPSQWKTLGSDIYYTSGNVGIGVSTGLTNKLTVAGTVSTNFLQLNNPFRLDGTLVTRKLSLIDVAQTDDSVSGSVTVESGELVYTDPAGNSVALSSPLNKGTGTEGQLAYFVSANALGETNIFFSNQLSEPRLTVSGNLHVTRELSATGFDIVSTVSMGVTNSMAIEAKLSHDGDLSQVKGYSAQEIDVDINKNWGNVDRAVQVIGLDVNLESKNGSRVLNNAQAVGVRVDVSSINVNATEGGAKYAAIFQGGNVGIGLTNPTTELEVAGTVSANFFTLSGGLNVPELNINGSSLVARSVQVSGGTAPRIGIGVASPETGSSELQVAGTISANRALISGGVEATTVNIHSGSDSFFFINASGNIGVGTTEPDGQIVIKKELASSSDDYLGQKIDVAIDGATPGSIFFFDKNITGMDIDLSSQASNRLNADAKGIKVDMTGLNMIDESTAIGLEVDVTGNTGTRYAAIFKGGRVGIGTDTPSADLHVSGNIIADNLLLEGFIQSQSATFNQLIVKDSATFNGTISVNRIVVGQGLTVNILTLLTNLTAPQASIDTLVADSTSINTLFKAETANILNGLTADTGRFNTSLGVNTDAPATGVEVSGNIVADTVTVTDRMTLTTATLNVNSGALFVASSATGKVGIGTTTPTAPLHVSYTEASAFNAARNTTWQGIRIQTRSDRLEAAAGILLTTDTSNTPSASVGSGIAAVRSNIEADETGSHLVFVTDPNDGVSAERMRILQDGKVGIGITNPSSILHVNGSALISGNVTANTLTVGTITSAAGVTFNTNGILAINGQTSVNARMILNDGMYLKPTSAPTALSGLGRLFVNESDNNLYYIEPNSTAQINLSLPFTGRSTRIPFFNSDGSLADDADLFWNDTTNTLQVGTDNVIGQVSVVATMSASASGEVALQKLTMNFADRSALSNPLNFTGLDILLGESGTGRLADGETAMGIRVDLTDVDAKQSSVEGTAFQGHKYGAVFLGGGVGIGTTSPQAGLHIVGEVAGNKALRIDTRSTTNTLVVDSTGYVGIGDSAPSSRLTVKGESNTNANSSFHAKRQSGATALFVRNDGNVGIGTNTPSTALDVSGVLNATEGRFGTLSGTTMNINNGSLFVDAAGQVGIGTTQPNGSISFKKSITPANVGTISTSTGFISEKVDITLAASGSTSQFNYTKDLTGVDIDLASAAGSRLGDGTSHFVATGVSVNTTGLALASNGVIVGLDVDVTGTGGTRHAALFNGGRVGIGVRIPSASLHVSGDIQATSLTLSGDLNVGAATINSLILSGSSTFNGLLKATNLIANTASVNNVVVTATLTVKDVSSTTLNVSTLMTSTRMGVGTTTPGSSFALDVVGDVRITGDLQVVNTINVNEIRSFSNVGNDITLRPTGIVVAEKSVSVNQDLKIGKALFIAKNDSVAADSTRGTLFTKSNGHLAYTVPGGVTVKITEALSGTAGRIPYFDTSQNLADTANIFWDENEHSLQIGTLNALTSVEVLTTLNNDVTGNYSGEKILLSFQDRSSNGAANTSFTGLDILMAGVNSGSSFGFGRLAPDETAIGLNVDVSKVRSKYSSTIIPDSDTEQSGEKYAAIFRGGSVGIGLTRPQAGVHIVSEVAGRKALRVDGHSLNNALVVDSNGRLGLNIASPEAQFMIKTTANTDAVIAMQVDNTSGTLLNLRGSGKLGVGFGTIPSANLHITGGIPFRVDTSTSSQHRLSVDSGLVGLGTGLPSSNLHIIGDGSNDILRIGSSAGNPSAMVVSNAGNVGMGITNPGFKLHVKGVVLTGTDNASEGFTSVPGFIRSGIDSTQGLLVNRGSTNLFFGLRASTTDTEVNEGILFYQNDLQFMRQITGSTANTTAMILKSDGKIGIGLTAPSAQLHVTGNHVPLQVGSTTVANALYVSGNGRVGIKTATPATDFHVNGTMMANSLSVSAGTVSISTLNITGSALITVEASHNRAVTAHSVVVSIDDDMQQDVVGLGINMSSSLDTDIEGGRRFAIYNGGIAYGLRVDMTNVGVNPPTLTNAGSKFAAVFLGGNVGIGTTAPKSGLHVETVGAGNGGVDIARFATEQSDLTIRDYDEGNMGFVVRNLTAPNKNFFPMSLSADRADSTSPAGRLGIGITNPDKTLVVNGDARIGVVRNDGSGAAESYGGHLYFSGGPDLDGSTSVDSENSDPIFMSRFNKASDETELRLSVGSGTAADGDDKFLIGWTSDNTPAGNYNKVVDIRMDGRVGIGDTLEASYTPQTVLHVKGNKSGPATSLANHVAVIENVGASEADSLAIYHSGTSNVNVSSNYIAFFDSTGLVGKISGNGTNGGVRYISQGADYAEYLEKTNASESIEKGDIVGVLNGKISKDTFKAQQVMVKSSGASVAGNYPGEDKQGSYALVAFFGQVPVKVVGPVNLGDFIVPSGKHNGTGIAVSPEHIHRYPLNNVVGRAWEASDAESMKLINTAVGFNFSLPSPDQEVATVHDLQEELKAIKSDRKELMTGFEKKLDDQNKEIERLIRLLNN